MVDLVTIPERDVLPVRSRVSWGAIIAGAVVALATHFLLTLLGAAIGLTVSDNVSSDTLGTGAAIWAILATAVALFVGGWVTSQCVAGEDKREAVIYGVIMWGVVFAMILWLVASGVRSGFGAMVGVANAAGNEPIAYTGLIGEARDAAESARAVASDPRNQEQARNTASNVTWWTLLGTVLSMAAAIAGAVVGAGPSFRLLGASTRITAGTTAADRGDSTPAIGGPHSERFTPTTPTTTTTPRT
jgi:hypothetical protein